MKKKLFFGLIGFAALLCGSLVSLKSYEAAKADGEVHVKVYDYSIVALAANSQDSNFRFALNTNALENNADPGYRYFSNDGVKITHDGVTTAHPGLITKEAQNQYCLEMGSDWAWDTETYGGGYQFLEGDTLEISGSFARRDGNGDTLEFTTPRKNGKTATIKFLRTSVGYENLGGENNVTITKDDIWFDSAFPFSGNLIFFRCPRSVLGGGDYDGVNRFTNNTALTVYNPDGSVAYTGKALVSKQYNFSGETDGDHGKWESFYVQIDAWKGSGVQTPVEIGGKFKIEGKLTSTANPAQSITFSDFEFERVEEKRYSAGTQIVNINNNTLINQVINNYSTYSIVDFELNEKHSLKADGAWNIYYQVPNGVTITHADGTTTVKHANLLVNTGYKFQLLFYGNFMDNEYLFQKGDSFTITGSVSSNSVGAFDTTFVWDYTFTPPQPVEADFNEETITNMYLEKVTDAREARFGYYSKLYIEVNFENGIAINPNGDGTKRIELKDAVTVTAKDGTKTTLKAVLMKPEAQKYYLWFSDGEGNWLKNGYDFKPGDIVTVNGTFNGTDNSGAEITIRYNFEYKVFDEVEVELDYTNWTYLRQQKVRYDQEGNLETKGVHFWVKVDFATNDKAPRNTMGYELSFFGNNDVTIYRRDGTSFTVNSMITEFDDNGEERLAISFCYWGNKLSKTWDFENGDKVVMNTNAKLNTVDLEERVSYSYTIHLEGTFYYAKEFEQVGDGPIVLEEAYQDVLAVEEMIDAIGEVTYPNSKDLIEEAEVAYSDLAPEPKSLVSNYDVLEAAKAEYKEQEEVFKVNDVENKINAIGTVEYTETCDNAIEAARSAYDALDEALKEKVSNYETLVEAEATYADLNDRALAANVDSLIDAIGTVEATDACERRIADARNAYEALNSTQAGYVTKLATLEAAEAQIEVKKLEKAAEPAINAINAIGTIDGSQSSKDIIETALRIYNSISSDAQAYVTNYENLVAAQSAFAAALKGDKDAAIALIDEFFAGLDLEKYTEENQEALRNLLARAKEAINNQEVNNDLQSLVNSYSEQMAAVEEKPAPAKGCGGSVIATSAILSSLALVGIGMISLKKKREE